MMVPGMRTWPPNFWRPGRRPALSRPLREEPPAFLCAILNLLRLRRRLLLRLFLRWGRPPNPRPAAGARCALGVDFGNPQQGLVLAVARFSPLNLPPLFFLNAELLGARLLYAGGAVTGAP